MYTPIEVSTKHYSINNFFIIMEKGFSVKKMIHVHQYVGNIYICYSQKFTSIYVWVCLGVLEKKEEKNL